MRTPVVHPRRLVLALCLAGGCATAPTNRTSHDPASTGAESPAAPQASPHLASGRAIPIESATASNGPFTATQPLPDGLRAATQVYFAAWASGDWKAVWALTASVDRAALVRVGRGPAEHFESTAHTQGFASSAALRGLSDEAWFTASRAALQALGALPAIQAVTGVSASAPLAMRFDQAVVEVVPVHLALESGKTVTMGAIREGDSWRFISP